MTTVSAEVRNRIEDRTFAGAEGLLTLVADEALLLARMDTDIAPTRLASGMTVSIGAEYGRGIHEMLLLAAWKRAKRSMSGSPFSLQVRFTTVQGSATLRVYGATNHVKLSVGLCPEKAILRQSPRVCLWETAGMAGLPRGDAPRRPSTISASRTTGAAVAQGKRG